MTVQKLQDLRARNAYGSTRGKAFSAVAGRTRTRAAGSRYVQRRWVEGVAEAAPEMAKLRQRKVPNVPPEVAAARAARYAQEGPHMVICGYCRQAYRCAWNCPISTWPREAGPDGRFDEGHALTRPARMQAATHAGLCAGEAADWDGNRVELRSWDIVYCLWHVELATGQTVLADARDLRRLSTRAATSSDGILDVAGLPARVGALQDWMQSAGLWTGFMAAREGRPRETAEPAGTEEDEVPPRNGE